MRAESLAAGASAIAAIASAFVAVIALLFAYHQETISREQLQATYSANLYSKQVDEMATIVTSLRRYAAGEDARYIFRDLNDDTYKGSPAELHALLEPQREQLSKALNDAVAANDAMRLLSPSVFADPVGNLIADVGDLYGAVLAFLKPPATTETMATLVQSVKKIYPPLSSRNAAIRDCARSPLSAGRPIATDTLTPECLRAITH